MRVLKFILQAVAPYRLYLWGMLFAILIVSIDANVKPYLIKLLIDTAAAPGTESITTLLIIYILSQAFMIGSWSFADWCAVRYTSPFRIRLTTLLTERLSLYSYSFFQNNLAGSLVAKIGDAFNLIVPIIFTIMYQFVCFALITLITLFLLAQVHILFALGLGVWIVLFSTMTYFGMKKANPLTTAYAESKSKIWGHLSDYMTNILNVRCFSAQPYEMGRFKEVSQDFVQKAQRQGYFLMNFYIIQGVVVSIYTLGFVIFLIYLQKRNLVTPGDFALVFMLNFKTLEKLHDLSHQLREFVTNWGTVDQALRILDLPIEIEDKPHAKELEVTHGEIVFQNVQFQYEGVDPLFQDKSVVIKHGQKVGLVGYSGAGKSTFVNLILRLFEVTSGRIQIDGQDIREITQDSLRATVGMIPQDPSLFHRTLMENIRYGRLEATDAEVIEAAKRAYAHEFISQLPQGYESLVGERGVKLSGGQRQRIAIARAILKNAPILILDEATSQLDSVTERDIQDSLWTLMQGKTTIVIAHRLSTLLHMDRILVFDKGKIIDDGPHDVLLANGRLYKTLWDAQVGGFLPDRVSGS